MKALAAALCLAVSAAALQPAARRDNVLLVTIDTVRADHVGAYGSATGATPTLDRLAREGIRFADATTQAPLTGPAHAAILTGRYPGRFGVRDNAATPIPESEILLSERFRSAGYRTGAFVGAFILDAQYGFAQGFDRFDSRFSDFSSADKRQARRAASEVTDAAIAWLRESSPQPFFAWVHLYDAHAPYRPPAPFRSRFAASPYDGAIASVDASVARLLAAVDADRTVVSVIADHGEGLGDHGEAEHGFFLYDSTLRVPWIVRLPQARRAGTIVSEQVRAIDVAPTLAALGGIPAGEHLDGENLSPLIDGGRRAEPPPSYAETFYAKLHLGWSDLRSVRIGAWKYIDAPKPELYDLTTDRGERRNVVEARGALASGLSAEARRLDAAFGAVTSAPAHQPDAETLARLRSLGYIGESAAGSSGGRGPDPKDMMPRMEAYRSAMSRATRAIRAGDAPGAIAILKGLVAEDPRSYEAHLFLGDAYVQRRQWRDALDEYSAARLLNPATAEPVIAAARAQLAAGDAAAALTLATDAERLEPRSDEVQLLIGEAHERQGLTARARDEYGQAVRTNPSSTAARARLAALALQLDDLATAHDQFSALLAMKYKPSRMHFGLGQVAERRGDVSAARSEYQAALAAEPTFAPAKAALARLDGARRDR